jgi:hypothetical protein
MIKRVKSIVFFLLLSIFFANSFAYNPTASEQTFVNVFNQKIDEAIKITPSRRNSLLNVMKMMYTRYHSNERIAWIFTALINHIE